MNKKEERKMTTGICIDPSEEAAIRKEAKRLGLRLSSESFYPSSFSSRISLEVIGGRKEVTSFYHWVWENQNKEALL